MALVRWHRLVTMSWHSAWRCFSGAASLMNPSWRPCARVNCVTPRCLRPRCAVCSMITVAALSPRTLHANGCGWTNLSPPCRTLIGFRCTTLASVVSSGSLACKRWWSRCCFLKVCRWRTARSCCLSTAITHTVLMSCRLGTRLQRIHLRVKKIATVLAPTRRISISEYWAAAGRVE